MKPIHTILLALLTAVLAFSSCSDEESINCTESATSIKTQLMEKDFLVKSEVKDEFYVLTFEQNTLKLPVSHVQNLEFNPDSWKSILTLIDGSRFFIPTLGTDITPFITAVTLNPSTYNPLAASLAVNMPGQGRIKIIVHTKPGLKSPDVTYLFKSVEASQVLPILGLYQDYANLVSIIFTDVNGKERARTQITIQTKPIENITMPTTIRVTKLKQDRIEPGMTLINSLGKFFDDTSVPFMIDQDGEVRWVLDWHAHKDLNHIGIDCGLTRLRSGHYVTGDSNNNLLAVVDFYGSIVKKWDMNDYGYSFHHAVTEGPKGSLMVTVSKQNAKLAGGTDARINDFLIEFNPKDDVIMKEWDFVSMLDSTRYNLLGDADPEFAQTNTAKNWLHNNGILKVGDEYLASSRYQGLFRFNRDGGIHWVIAPHKGWRKKYRPFLLQPLHADGSPIVDPEIIEGTKKCDDFDWPWGPHSAVLLPNNHIMCYDNGYGRQFQKQSDQNYSRAVEYEVNLTNMTVRQVWEYGKERGNSFYSFAMSSANYLPQTGNRLIGCAIFNTFSDGTKGARVVEVDPKTNEELFEVELVDCMLHRAYRMSLYPEGL